MYDVFIIGGGPAGMTAGIYAARAGYKTALIEQMGSGGQMTTTPEIENYPGIARISGIELAMQMEAHAKGAGVSILRGEVKELALSEEIKRARLFSGEEYECRAVILCMGASRRKLGIPGEEEFIGRGVSFCAACDGNFFRGRKVAVVGGGNTALEDAAYLSKICETVYLIHRRNEFRGVRFLQDRVREAKNIELVLDSIPLEIRGGASVSGVAVKNVKTGEARELAVSGVFCAVGTMPRTELVRGLVPLDESGYIAAGEDCKTSVPGVFAAGDLRRKPLYQIVTAAADGATAAKAVSDYLG